MTILTTHLGAGLDDLGVVYITTTNVATHNDDDSINACLLTPCSQRPTGLNLTQINWMS